MVSWFDRWGPSETWRRACVRRQANRRPSMRTPILSVAMALPLTLAAATMATAAPDQMISKQPTETIKVSTVQRSIVVSQQIAEVAATKPKQGPLMAKDAILYNIISDQISEMRRKSALPDVMCIAESTGDGGAETIARNLMTRLQADNAQVQDSLFTLKAATECETAGNRMLDRETHERAMVIVAGPVETDMKGLTSGCGDYVGGFVRASDDSDFDFYSVNGGAVARKLGCEMAQ